MWTALILSGVCIFIALSMRPVSMIIMWAFFAGASFYHYIYSLILYILRRTNYEN